MQEEGLDGKASHYLVEHELAKLVPTEHLDFKLREEHPLPCTHAR
jgi:hypothetical protein